MVCCMVLISNNPAFFPCKRQGLEVVPMHGTAYDVAVAARDRVHQGWRVLNHPLYGNFRPYHQPFRSMLLQPPVGEACNGVYPVDPVSLDLMEQALEVYRSCADRWAVPEAVPVALYNDCSFLDCQLMQATLDAYCPL